MPEQENGLLSGFQLWVNLPAAQKMSKPKYQEYDSNEISVEKYSDDIEIKVIAGRTQQGTLGVIVYDIVETTYWDVSHQADAELTEQIREGHNAFVYVYKGSIKIAGTPSIATEGQLAVLTDGELLKIEALYDSKYLVIAAKPLGEPISRGGLFVMNTREEVNQVFHDYQTGNLVR